MKRKAMEIEKSKMESARTGKAGTSAYAPSNMSSITINNNRSATDLDLTPTFSRYARPWHLPQRSQHMHISALSADNNCFVCDPEDALARQSPPWCAGHESITRLLSCPIA